MGVDEGKGFCDGIEDLDGLFEVARAISLALSIADVGFEREAVEPFHHQIGKGKALEEENTAFFDLNDGRMKCGKLEKQSPLTFERSHEAFSRLRIEIRGNSQDFHSYGAAEPHMVSAIDGAETALSGQGFEAIPAVHEASDEILGGERRHHDRFRSSRGSIPSRLHSS